MKKEEQIWEQGTRDLLKNVELDRPSLDFSANVMEQISGLNENVVRSHKPIIGKGMWFGIITSVLLVLSYTIFFTKSGTGIFGNAMDKLGAASEMLEFQIPSLDLPISPIMLNCLLIFGVFMLVQIFLIRKQHNRQFS